MGVWEKILWNEEHLTFHCISQMLSILKPIFLGSFCYAILNYIQAYASLEIFMLKTQTWDIQTKEKIKCCKVVAFYFIFF